MESEKTIAPSKFNFTIENLLEGGTTRFKTDKNKEETDQKDIETNLLCYKSPSSCDQDRNEEHKAEKDTIHKNEVTDIDTEQLKSEELEETEDDIDEDIDEDIEEDNKLQDSVERIEPLNSKSGKNNNCP